MPLAQNEQVIQAFVTNRANPALRYRVRLWSLEWREHDFDALGDEDAVKCSRELGVVVVDQEPHLRWRVGEVPHQLACLLGHPGTVGCWGTPRHMHPSRTEFN